MATGIPTFKVDIAEGMINVDTSADRLFAYCIEADKGPINEPTFVASNKEALRKFGKDFAPHFYQNPTGLVIIRVGFDGAKEGEIVYSGKKTGSQTADKLLTIKARYPGPCKHKVIINHSLIGDGLSLSVVIDDVTSKNYQNLKDLKKVAERINSRFGDFLVAEFELDSNGVPLYDELENDKKTRKYLNANLVFPENNTGDLVGGTNGYMLRSSDQQKAQKTGGGYYEVDDEQYGINGTDTSWKSDTEGVKPNPNTTLQVAYTEAFDKSSYVDVIGVSTLSDKEIVRNVLRTHINYMSDPEVHSYRFGITSVLPTDDDDGVRSISTLASVPQGIDSEWVILIGQGVVFQKEGELPFELPPHEAVQLFTGIRSSLGYSEAIFGGEQKKVLRGVVDTLPVTNDGIPITKDDIIELNQAGVCTFKKEYDEVTFVEGVTTLQDEDVMTYENMMSIIAYVVKRLVRIAKPYQGQRLTEDLKTTLQTALSAELRSITETDGTLMALEEFNIPPYDVQVYSAAKTKFDETNRLVRESKIIIQCRIVPIGALRDIDLHVIAI